MGRTAVSAEKNSGGLDTEVCLSLTFPAVYSYTEMSVRGHRRRSKKRKKQRMMGSRERSTKDQRVWRSESGTRGTHSATHHTTTLHHTTSHLTRGTHIHILQLPVEHTYYVKVDAIKSPRSAGCKRYLSRYYAIQ